MAVVMLCAAIGAVLGILSATALSPVVAGNLLPWALAALALGGCWPRTALRGGASYGFALVLSFMVAGYRQDHSVLTQVAAVAVLSTVGTGCGSALAGIGAAVGQRAARGAP